MPLFTVYSGRLRWLSAIILALSSVSTQANQPAPTSVTLDDLLQQVRSNNAGLSAQSLQAQAQALRIDSADDLADPQLMYGLAPRSLGLDDGDEGHVFGLSQALPWPGKRKQQRLAAIAQAENANAALESHQRMLVLRTRLAFADWVQRYQELSDNKQHEAHLKTLELSARQALASGKGNQQAAIRTQLRLLETRKRANTLSASLQQTISQLNALRQESTPLGQSQPGQLAMPMQVPGMERLITGLAMHPQIQQLDAQIQAAEARLQISELSRWPDPKLQLQHFGVRPREEYRSQVSISFDLPINQSRRNSEIAARKAELDALQAQKRNLHAHLTMQLEQAHAEWQAAQQNWQLYQQQWLPAAQQQVDVSRAQFAAASGDIMSLIDAEHAWLNAKTESVRLHSEAFRAYAQILWLSGSVTALGKE